MGIVRNILKVAKLVKGGEQPVSWQVGVRYWLHHWRNSSLG
jgi:hypothetical protein